MIKYGDPNYVETLKDCIRMALIFADFKISKKVHSHVGDNIIYCIEMCNIRAILKQSLNVST